MMLRRTVLALFVLGLVACQSAKAPIEVEEAWGPEAPSVAHNGIFYMRINNNSQTDDRLIDVSSPGCTAAELHETYENEHGLMGMRYLPEGLVVPAGESVTLEIGGLHIMCLDKTADFQSGDHIPLSLTFAAAGDLSVEAEIH